MQRRGLGVLLAAAAAYGFYKYRRMTPEQKNGLMEKGKGLLNKSGLGNLFGKKTAATNNGY
jgi:hypothetical protein